MAAVQTWNRVHGLQPLLPRHPDRRSTCCGSAGRTLPASPRGAGADRCCCWAFRSRWSGWWRSGWASWRGASLPPSRSWSCCSWRSWAAPVLGRLGAFAVSVFPGAVRRVPDAEAAGCHHRGSSATASMIIGIPAYIDGYMIEIPQGTFFVAEACAGLRFLIASIAFGCLYALMMYRSPVRRGVFIVASIIVPIIANGFRGLGIVLSGLPAGQCAGRGGGPCAVRLDILLDRHPAADRARPAVPRGYCCRRTTQAGAEVARRPGCPPARPSPRRSIRCRIAGVGPVLDRRACPGGQRAGRRARSRSRWVPACATVPAPGTADR